jgi:hypothetical protein
MQVPERDSTRDWELPEDARPPLLSELVARIDEALATARASEAAVMTVGEAAIESAEQARKAAELAERASAALLERTDRAPDPVAMPKAPRSDDTRLRDFSARADRLAERLKQLQKTPEIPPVWGGPSAEPAVPADPA